MESIYSAEDCTYILYLVFFLYMWYHMFVTKLHIDRF
jgi:hypothetical protein